MLLGVRVITFSEWNRGESMLDISGKVVFFLFPTSNANIEAGGKAAMEESHALRMERQKELGPGTLAALGGCVFQLGGGKEGLSAGLKSELRTEGNEALLLSPLE